MSTTDGTGQDEPRYGRRLPEGQQPPAYGQQPPTYGQQPPGAPGSYPQQGGYGAPPSYGQPGPMPGGYAPAGYGQQYGAPGGYGPGPSSGPRPKRTGAVITLVLGVILMLGAPIAGFAIAIASATDSFSDIAIDGAQLNNGGSVELPANVDRMAIFEASNITPGAVSCDVTDPGGRSLPVSDTADIFGSQDVPLPGITFRTTSAGSYTISCDLPSNVNQSIIVTPPLDFDSLLSGGMAVLIGLAVGFLGFVMMIIGIIWLVRVNKRIRTAQY